MQFMTCRTVAAVMCLVAGLVTRSVAGDGGPICLMMYLTG
jgi:hypothetical protein